MKLALPSAVQKYLPDSDEWRGRFAAWWDGEPYEPPAPLPDMPEVEKEPEPEEPVDEGPKDDVVAHSWVSECLWGRGFNTPLSQENLEHYIAPLALDETTTCLCLGTGVGGVPRLIANETGVWITGKDRHKQLFPRARIQGREDGLEKRVTIEAYDPETVDLPAAKFKGVTLIEELRYVANKERLLTQVNNTLKRKGAVMIIDFVLADDADPSLGAACFPEIWGEARLWKESEYVEALANTGFDLRVNADVTREYIDGVMQGWSAWRRIEKQIQAEPPDSPRRGTMMLALALEASHWANCFDSLQNGSLKVHRFFGLKKSKRDGKPG